MVENPTQCFGEHIRWIYDSRKVNQYDVLHKSPVLKCKIPDFDMTGAISWPIVIDNLDHRVVVFVYGTRLSLSIPQLMKNETQILHDFCGSICGDKFGFCGTLCTDGLCWGTISHDTTGQTASIACPGSTVTQFIGMGYIHVSDQLPEMWRWRDHGKRVIKLNRIIGHLWRCIHGFGTPTHDAPPQSCVWWR